MNEHLEPTVLPFNKNKDDKSEMIRENISINKSLVDDLCARDGLESWSCFLSATVVVLTKYTNSNNVLISTNINSRDVCLSFNDENRKKTVIGYIRNMEKHLDRQINHCIDGYHFSFVYGDTSDIEDENTTLSVRESFNQYLLELKFDANRYTQYYIRSFLRSIKRVLNQFIDCGIDNLNVEDIALRDEKPPIKYELKRSPLVNELLENQANKTPEKVALITCGEKYTFKQVNDEANRIANALIKRGIEKGSTISLMLARDKTLITTFLGIIKAGCVAIPLDMNFPPERISYIIVYYEKFIPNEW